MEFCCRTETDDIDYIRIPTQTHHEVPRGNISMNNTSGMDKFQTMKELVGEQQDCFEGELGTAEFEEKIQTKAQSLNYNGSVARIFSSV